MSFLASLFPVRKSGSSDSFWKDRALSLEIELKELREKSEKELRAEQIRNRKREDLLLDRCLVSKGLYPISRQVEKELGFKFDTPPKELTEAEKNEMKYFIENSVANGKSAKEAEEFWLKNYRHKLE